MLPRLGALLQANRWILNFIVSLVSINCKDICTVVPFGDNGYTISVSWLRAVRLRPLELVKTTQLISPSQPEFRDRQGREG